MKIIIVFKLCKDPKDATVGGDGKADYGMAALAASDDDFRCTEIAKELGGEIVGLTIGNGDIAWAAARGASKTVLITDAMPSLDASDTAAVLAEAVRRIEDADLVLIGDSAWDPAVPVLLGAKLGWNSLAGITDVHPVDSGFSVRRRTASAEKEIIVSGPAVLGIAARSGEETPPGLKQVLMARKKPVEKLTVSDLGIEPEQHVELTGWSLPESTEAEMITGETPEEKIDKLFKALKEEGVLS